MPVLRYPGTIAEGEVRLVQGDDVAVCVVRTDGLLYAVDDACPHGGGSLSEGWLEGGCIACPLHGWAFELATGACLGRPVEIATFPVDEDEDGVRITVP